jgi:hypothetical protein
MRASSILALAAAALVAGACITYVAGPTTAPTFVPTPTAAQITQAPTVAPPPTPVVTLEPGATPSFDIRAILNGQITVFNLSDADLSVSAVIHDPSPDGEDIPISAFTLGPNQATTRSVIGGNEETGAVPYLLEFTYAGGSTAGGSCTVSVLKGQDFTFVAVNDGLTIARNEEVPAAAAEAVIATSSLCVAPPAPTVTP